jgi:hypothetical protein
MKKKLLLIAIILFSLISCTQSEVPDNNLDSSKIARMLNEDDKSARILMYSLLNKEEKFQIWNNQISDIISKENLSSKQLELIIDLKERINIKLFDSSIHNYEREIFKTIYVSVFLSQAKEIFEYNFIYQKFFNVGSETSFISSRLNGQESIGIQYCVCNDESAFSCNWNTDKCSKSNNCRKTKEGCGFLWSYECNGRCFFN